MRLEEFGRCSVTYVIALLRGVALVMKRFLETKSQRSSSPGSISCRTLQVRRKRGARIVNIRLTGVSNGVNRIGCMGASAVAITRPTCARVAGWKKFSDMGKRRSTGYVLETSAAAWVMTPTLQRCFQLLFVARRRCVEFLVRIQE